MTTNNAAASSPLRAPQQSSGVASFTPGPWAVNCSHIYAPDGAIIAVVHNPGSKESDYPLVANRDLMAAAPELYEACNKALPVVEELVASGVWPADDLGDRLALDAIVAALAKARGEA